jgi:hypothetical protein
MDNISKGKFSAGEKRVLEKASHFIDTVVQGKRYVDDLTLGENCVEATQSYGAALKALRRLNQEGDPSPIFTKYADLLREIERNEKQIDNELSSEIENIKLFFKALRMVSWENVERPAEEVVLHGVP